MKRLSILFLSVMALGLSVSSCNNDDDNEGTLEGKWILTQEGVVLNGLENLQPVTTEGGCDSEIFEYLNNGTVINTYSEYFNSKCNDEIENGTWSRNGNMLTEKFEGESEGTTYEIASLTGSQLKLKETYTEQENSVSFIRVFTKK